MAMLSNRQWGAICSMIIQSIHYTSLHETCIVSSYGSLILSISIKSMLSLFLCLGDSVHIIIVSCLFSLLFLILSILLASHSLYFQLKLCSFSLPQSVFGDSFLSPCFFSFYLSQVYGLFQCLFSLLLIFSILIKSMLSPFPYLGDSLHACHCLYSLLCLILFISSLCSLFPYL